MNKWKNLAQAVGEILAALMIAHEMAPNVIARMLG
jgi:hypothetical protein